MSSQSEYTECFLVGVSLSGHRVLPQSVALVFGCLAVATVTSVPTQGRP